MKNRLLLILLCALFNTSAFSQQYDTLIRNGKVVDGSSNPWFYGDVGIIGDRIAFIGHAAIDVKAKRTIDATGLIVAPGFIDMLGQSETNLLIDKRAVSKRSLAKANPSHRLPNRTWSSRRIFLSIFTSPSIGRAWTNISIASPSRVQL